MARPGASKKDIQPTPEGDIVFKIILEVSADIHVCCLEAGRLAGSQRAFAGKEPFGDELPRFLRNR